MTRALSPNSGSAVRPREVRTGLGLAMMALAILCFTGIDTTAKWLILAGLMPLQVVFIRYAGHFLISCAIYLPREGVSAFRSQAPRRQALRSCLLLGGTIFNFFALKSLPITLTITIFYATPIFVTLLAIPLLGERVGIRRILAVIVGFGGVVVTVQPWGASFNPAILLSICALVCASGYLIMTRMLAGVESNATSQLWSSGLAFVVLSPFAFQPWAIPLDALTVMVMVFIGACGAFGHIAVTFAHRLADASILAPIIYVQILFASVAGIVVFSTPPQPTTLMGGSIIVASGLYIWHRERRKT